MNYLHWATSHEVLESLKAFLHLFHSWHLQLACHNPHCLKLSTLSYVNVKENTMGHKSWSSIQGIMVLQYCFNLSIVCQFSMKGLPIRISRDINSSCSIVLSGLAVANTKQQSQINMLQLLHAQLLAQAKPITFECDLATHTKCHWHAPNVRTCVWKGNERKTRLQRAETPLIASWVHQVCASDSFSRTLVLEWAFPRCFLPHELCKAGWVGSWTSKAVVWTLVCLSLHPHRLWNPRTSHCLVANFIRSAGWPVSKFPCLFMFWLSVLPKVIKGQSD